MSYISLSDKDLQEMLDKIGISNVDELFTSIPEGIRLQRPLDVPGPLTEPELASHFEKLGGQNLYSKYLSFLGAGVYAHHIPAIVDYLSSRGEFVSPYTPYQPEVSQGTLQLIFEFQTLICQLTGMDIANASLYDGASGAAEAVLMANRLNQKKRILVSRALHPQYRETIATYTRDLGIHIEEIGFLPSGQLDLAALEQHLDDDTSAVIFQSPNFFGVIEDVQGISEIMHNHHALSVAVVTEPVSLGILAPPGEMGVDIVTGEAQSFGIPVSYGGPILGFMACGKNYLRQLPGRIVGETKDVEGRRGYVLTLSTREQHIRRERATSNICTNQALCLLRATVFLEALGKKGLRDMAWQNIQKAHYAINTIQAIQGVTIKFSGTCFNEFVLEFPRPWQNVKDSLQSQGIIGGLGLEEYYPELTQCALVCVTETHSQGDINIFASALKKAIEQ